MANSSEPLRAKRVPLNAQAVFSGRGYHRGGLGHGNADVEQLKSLLAAEIIKALDRDGLTVRAAHARTGFAAADFSRIRNADLSTFTTDRLVSILNRLGSRISHFNRTGLGSAQFQQPIHCQTRFVQNAP